MASKTALAVRWLAGIDQGVIVTNDDAADALGVTQGQGTAILASLARDGLLARERAGVYRVTAVGSRKAPTGRQPRVPRGPVPGSVRKPRAARQPQQITVNVIRTEKDGVCLVTDQAGGVFYLIPVEGT